MFRITSETDLLDSFRPFERSEVELEPLLRFPLNVKDYLSWTDSSNTKTFLVFSDNDKTLGVVFRRGSGGTIAMCEWCHSVGEGNSVQLLSATASSNRRVGVHVCGDLSCAGKIRSVPGASDFPKSGSERERIRAVIAQMSRFVRQNLF